MKCSKSAGWLTAVLLICWATTASADGNKFLSECQAAERALDRQEEVDEFGVGHCLGVIQGIQDSLTLLEDGIQPSLRVCWPRQDGKPGIKLRQALRIVLNYLREHPADLHTRESFLVIRAFKAAYPCKRSP